jgi:hypothetical protein
MLETEQGLLQYSSILFAVMMRVDSSEQTTTTYNERLKSIDRVLVSLVVNLHRARLISLVTVGSCSSELDKFRVLAT